MIASDGYYNCLSAIMSRPRLLGYPDLGLLEPLVRFNPAGTDLIPTLMLDPPDIASSFIPLQSWARSCGVNSNPYFIAPAHVATPPPLFYTTRA